MPLRPRTINEIAEMICGNKGLGEPFRYRSSSYLSEFFEDVGTEHRHDGSTRSWWVSEALKDILARPWPNPATPPPAFVRVIASLMDQADAVDEGPSRPHALEILNTTLARDGFAAFYGEDRICHLRHTGTNAIASPNTNLHRTLTPEEAARQAELAEYLDGASEDDLLEQVLVPLFRRLGFERIYVPGHRDKALEYGKDLWMRFTLPTGNRLYFGVQAKRGTIDASGKTRTGNANVAELLNQITMMLGHAIFDPDANREVLVDHAFLVAGGTITKAARNWLGAQLDASRRSQIMFLDRDDILRLVIVSNVPLPSDMREFSEF